MYYDEEDYMHVRKKTDELQSYFPADIQRKIAMDLSQADVLVLKDTANTNEPYLSEVIVQINRKYNPDYGGNQTCECGHSYDRHFDSYENMSPVGCKYCPCNHFKENKSEEDES